MTAAEWDDFAGPAGRMLWAARHRLGDRKLRLLACGLGRRLWDRLRHDALRRAVEVGESAADGAAGLRELVDASEAAFQVAAGSGNRSAAYAAANAAFGDALDAARAAVARAGAAGLRKAGVVAVLRCVCGNPFRPVAFDTAWRTDTAVTIAAGMYDSRDFEAMPILADALQDAGCEDEQVLAHCRQAGAHVRGCWVADGVLGKG